MVTLNLLSEEFANAAAAAWNGARQDALNNGHPVFFHDEDGSYILEDTGAAGREEVRAPWLIR
jgi:hypothetical protein